MPLHLKKVGEAPHHDLMIADNDEILIVIPEPGFKDTADASRRTVEALREYARTLGRKCGLVVVANNLMAQEPESRRVYSEQVTADLFYGITLVVSSLMARAIGTVAIRFTKMPIPFSLSSSIESGIDWVNAQDKTEQ
jgi:hypothetical protein